MTEEPDIEPEADDTGSHSRRKFLGLAAAGMATAGTAAFARDRDTTLDHHNNAAQRHPRVRRPTAGRR